MNLSLEGKYAIVCGSTQGIGLAIAEELALMGANCTLIARNEEGLKSAVRVLDIALRQQHNYLVADFTRPEELRKIIAAHMEKFPAHILINNTGGPPGGGDSDGVFRHFFRWLVGAGLGRDARSDGGRCCPIERRVALARLRALIGIEQSQTQADGRREPKECAGEQHGQHRGSNWPPASPGEQPDDPALAP